LALWARFFPRGKLARRRIHESLEWGETGRCQPGISPQTAIRCWAAPNGLVETRQRPGCWSLGEGSVSLPTPADPARRLGMCPVGAGGGGREAHLAVKWSPTEQHRCGLLLIRPSPSVREEHPQRGAVMAEPWASVHPQLPRISLRSRGTWPFPSLPSLWLRALLLPAEEKPC